MLDSLRRRYAELITPGIQLIFVALGFELASAEGWLYCLGAIAAISLFAWMSVLKRLRAIRDTPTSKIASAAQGYAELTGWGVQFGDAPLLARLSQRPCLWYRYSLERRTSDNEWKVEDSGQSDDSFLLRDETGVCIVDPEFAEIFTSVRETWQSVDCRNTEWRLQPGDLIYVIGEFSTRSCSLEFDSRAEVLSLLTEWKKDMPELVRRYDLDRDGELDMDEWALVRQAAHREVARLRRDAEQAADIHMISRPSDKNPFLISNLPPEKLSRRYLVWSWAHLLIFFGALGAAGWVDANL